MMKRQDGERGTTLLDLIAGMAITALILCGIIGLIFQEWRGTAIGKTSVTVAHEIGYAARMLSQDGAMAQSTDLVGEAQPVNNLTLTWIERQEFLDLPHYSSYCLEENQLRREYDGIVTTVARNISNIEFSQTGRLLTVSISCTPQWWVPDGTVEKTYRIYLRPAEES